MARRLVLLLVLVLGLAGCSGEASTGPKPSAAKPSAESPSGGAGEGNADQLGVIGDSLTAEMIEYGLLQPALEALGWDSGNLRMDGLSGRPIESGGTGSTTDVVKDWRAEGFDPRVWLIALGTNNSADSDAEWSADIRAVLDEIGSGPAGNYTIYWVTTGYQDAGEYHEQEFEDVVREIAKDYPDVTVADYSEFLEPYRDDPKWDSWWSDPVHHSESGYAELRTPFYVQTLEPESPA